MTDTRAHRGAFVEPEVMVSQGWRLFVSGIRRKLFGYERYTGSAAEICEQIVRQCFDPAKRFFKTSTTSYPEFWARDFGRCVPALLALGLESEVGDTYRYALSHYADAGHFALVITPGGRLFDFPAYAPDGFAFFLFGLEKLGDQALIERNRLFLEREIRRFAALVLDSRTGLVRRARRFSEAQDYAVRDSSCYSNCICHLLQHSLDALGLPNPLGQFAYRSLILERFWAGDHFLDDQSLSAYPSGDAQVLPFWTGLMGHGPSVRECLDTVLRWMDAHGLNRPLPCRYGVSRLAGRRMHVLHWFNPWQLNNVWTCLGLHLLEVLSDFEHPRFAIELERYRTLVERVGCFPEVLDHTSGELYEGPLVMSEGSMLWAANLWSMLDRTANSLTAAERRARLCAPGCATLKADS
jgi:hypothetical protein